MRSSPARIPHRRWHRWRWPRLLPQRRAHPCRPPCARRTARRGFRRHGQHSSLVETWVIRCTGTIGLTPLASSLHEKITTRSARNDQRPTTRPPLSSNTSRTPSLAHRERQPTATLAEHTLRHGRTARRTRGRSETRSYARRERGAPIVLSRDPWDRGMAGLGRRHQPRYPRYLPSQSILPADTSGRESAARARHALAGRAQGAGCTRGTAWPPRPASPGGGARGGEGQLGFDSGGDDLTFLQP